MNLNQFFSNPRNIIITLLLLFLTSLGFNIKDIVNYFAAQTEDKQVTINKRFSIVVRDKDKQPIKDVKIQWLYCNTSGFGETEDNGNASIKLIENCPSKMLLTLTKDNYETKNIELYLKSIEEGEIKPIVLDNKDSITKPSSSESEKSKTKDAVDNRKIEIIVKQDTNKLEQKKSDITNKANPKLTAEKKRFQPYKIQYFRKRNDPNADKIATVLHRLGLSFDIGTPNHNCPISRIWYGTRVDINEALDIAAQLNSINVKTKVEPFPSDSINKNKALIQLGGMRLYYPDSGRVECE